MRVRLILIKETRKIARRVARWDRHVEFPGRFIVGTGELGSGAEDSIHRRRHIGGQTRWRVIAMRNRNFSVRIRRRIPVMKRAIALIDSVVLHRHAKALERESDGLFVADAKIV